MRGGLHDAIPPYLREATRLTQAGQLHEAMALLQRGLRGAPEGEAEAPVLDLVPDRVTVADAPATARGGEGRFLTLHHTEAGGSRACKLYVPGGHQDRLLPLLVMLHGCT